MINLIKRDLKKNFSNIHFLASPLAFLVICSFIFGFSLPDEIRENQFNGYSIILASCLLAFCLITTTIFEEDHKSGILQLLYMNCGEKFKLIAAKIISVFLSYSIGFVLVTPLLGMMFNIELNNIVYLSLIILLTCLLFSFISIMIAGIILGLKNGGVLSSILILPIFIPVLIIDLGFFKEIMDGDFEIIGYLQSIFGLSLIYAPLSFIIGVYGVRSVLEEG